VENIITIFSDFDGVLFDTLKEAFVLCRKVLCDVDFFEPIDEILYSKFYRYKYLVFNSWQYFYFMKTLLEFKNGSDNEFIQEYNKKLKSRDLKNEEFFESEFLRSRKYLLEQYPDFVDSLESKFVFFDKFVSLRNNPKYDIIIVSRKNNFAIQKRLLNNGVEGIKIIGKEELSPFIHKSEFISEYMNKNNINKAFFIDDNSHNLLPCENIPHLTCFLAGWGNIGIDEKGLSGEEIFNKILNI